MRAPHTRDLAGVDAAVYGIPFDTATSFRTGPRFGPEAIRSGSALLRPYNPALEVNVVEKLSIVDYGDVPVSPGDTERTYGQVEEALAPLVEAGVFPLALGGDHSVTLAELRVLARKHGPLVLLQLDAHGDTWDEYFGQRFFHGTTFKRAVEEQLIDPSASVQAGLRGSLYAAEDIESAREMGFAVLSCEQLRKLGPAATPASSRLEPGRVPSSSPSTSTSSTRRSPRGRVRRRSAASRRPRRSRSSARCGRSTSSAPTSSRSRRRTTAPGSKLRSRRRTSPTSCSASALSQFSDSGSGA